MFGSSDNSAQLKLQQQALAVQQRQANATEEDAAVTAANATPPRRILGMGRRALAYMGSEMGVSGSSLNGDS